MLTSQEAKSFLADKLGIADVEAKLERNRLQLVDEILYPLLHYAPFNNIELMSCAYEDRTAPAEEDVKRMCLSGAGGLCWTINTFMFRLLEALGYDVYLVLGNVIDVTTDNHVAIIMKDLQKRGDRHLVDAGLGYPNFQVVSLDFETESQVYEHSYHTYKFTRNVQQFARMHLKRPDKNDPSASEMDDNTWVKMYTFTLEVAGIEELRATLNQSVYTNKIVKFNKGLRICAFEGGKSVILVNDTLLLEEKHGSRLVPTKLQNDEEILRVIQKYIPGLSEVVIKKAIQNWRNVSDD